MSRELIVGPVPGVLSLTEEFAARTIVQNTFRVLHGELNLAGGEKKEANGALNEITYAVAQRVSARS